ncbi:NAD(P)/FAD-dependent oxidoreductase [Denitrobaculum tricleocarpae]|uniref:TIGR03862 family flavoprotein n=1 Tax=Denitrobaculum tricleocarpae TaxID=2591009 RepID=A0A545TUG2_9PROT|nr:TIGR03862 family flavoprotein [Denitrobaculum tricleocarpae]TQV80849.1 TIGR03862 family flavoprotein [Denitrobaculum tricleocarpae]
MESARPRIAIVGGGPAGLMAAQRLSAKNFDVALYEAKASFGRKFLLAGRGGLNLTHSEDSKKFIARYGPSATFFQEKLARFSPDDLRSWSEDLGIKTFVGSSGRVFPQTFKASPLLRAWLRRLQEQGVVLQTDCRWQGIKSLPPRDAKPGDAPLELRILNRDGIEFTVIADAILLALGGASWPRMGSDGKWLQSFKQMGVPCTEFQPSNCGFNVSWSESFKQRYAGTALKNLGLTAGGAHAKGEIMIADYGVEGGGVYALGRALRTELRENTQARLVLDLKPDLDRDKIEQRLSSQRTKDSLSSRLRKSIKLAPAAAALLRECHAGTELSSPEQVAAAVKAVPVALTGSQPLERAISSVGGLELDAVNHELMIKNLPGVFVAGEMLDWDAPTGGYLLQGTFATAACAAEGIENWLSVLSSHSGPTSSQ